MIDRPIIARSPWTPDEDAQLQALAISGKSAAAIAAELKRTEISVRSRASKLRVLLGTRKENDQASFHCKPTMDARGRRSASNSSYIWREYRRDLEASVAQRRGTSSPCSRARNRVEKRNEPTTMRYAKRIFLSWRAPALCALKGNQSWIRCSRS